MWRLLHNPWIVFSGMAVIAFFTVFGTCLGVSRSSTQSGSQSRALERATPQPSATPTPDLNLSPTPTVSPTPTAPPIQRRYPAAPEMQIDPEKQYFATIQTDKGAIRVQLFPKDAPEAVNSFVFLARNHYYDGLTFNRVSQSFAQGGDAGTGTPGYTIPVQANGLRHDPGAFALARSNATSGLSGQFYITLQPLPNQDGRDTVIGKVDGLSVAQSLTPRDPDKSPNAPPGDKILSVTIDERPTG
jgi:cyclophilin family peptidyl-prolyl cis-trans isomerase